MMTLASCSEGSVWALSLVKVMSPLEVAIMSTGGSSSPLLPAVFTLDANEVIIVGPAQIA